MNLKNELNERFDTLKEGVGNFAADVQNNGRRVWLASLGMLSTVDERSRRAFEELVEKGEARKVRLDASVDEALGKVKDFQGDVEQQVNARVGRTLERFGVPSSQQIQQLMDRVEQLHSKVEQLAH